MIRLPARISHQPSTATAQWRTLHDFSSVIALDIVPTMPAHPPNNVCRFWQTLLGVVAKVMQRSDVSGTAFRRLATKAGEICGLILASLISSAAFAAEPIVISSSDRQTAVLELYTSEGCSSCPRADRWLSKLVTTPQPDLDVLALAFHVDYWDYLGWKDRFSSADYTKRQRVLGANNLQRTIYTPEFFVNGIEARGSGNILDKIQQTNQKPAALALQMIVSRDKSELVVALQAPAERGTIGQIHHRYLVYENNLSTDVKRGENSGEVLHHQQVVRYMSPAQSLQTENQHRISIDPDWQSENIGIAVLVTSPGDRHYLQAVHTPVASLLAAR